MHLHSIQIGKVVTEGDPASTDVTDRLWTSAFRKDPIEGPVRMTHLGIEGDEVANTKSHGGIDKAVLCYSAQHYTDWLGEHPEWSASTDRGEFGPGAFGPGAFAENLTIAGQDETNVCIGDRYSVGQCEIEISQPRQPCWKIARRWGTKCLPKEVGQNGRTGWYVRVTREGEINAGDQVELTRRPQPNWSVARANDIFMGREVDRMAVIELMNLEELADAWKDVIA